MRHTNHHTVVMDDGSVFATTPVRLPGSELDSVAIAVNNAIQTKAAALLPSAQAMAEARATRVSFFRATRRSLAIEESAMYEEAKRASIESADRVSALFLLASGVSFDEQRVVTVTQWREVLAFFKQDMNVGAAVVFGG